MICVVAPLTQGSKHSASLLNLNVCIPCYTRREAHETLAIGVNRVGAKSNSGEGGEDPMRFGTIDDVDEEGHSES